MKIACRGDCGLSIWRELFRSAVTRSVCSQQKLSEVYAWADLFFTPTLEDGFAVVLTQAQASALPILCTENCGGPDLIAEGETRWILPIRSPEASAKRLRWCGSHREELAAMVEHLHGTYQPRDWSDVASDFEWRCQEIIFPSNVSAVAKIT